MEKEKISKEDLAKKFDDLFLRYTKVQSVEDILAVVKEYAALAKEVDINDIEACKLYNDFEDKAQSETVMGGKRLEYNGYTGLRGSDLFSRAIEEMPIDDRRTRAEILATLLQDKNVYRNFVSLKLINFSIENPENFSKSQMARVEELIRQCKNHGHADMIKYMNLVKDICNVGGLSQSTRSLVNSVVDAYKLQGKFQTKDTFNKLFKGAQYSKYSVIKETLAYWTDPKVAKTKYYLYFGNDSGQMPETRTGLFDAYIAGATTHHRTAKGDRYDYANDADIKKIRTSFIIQDILEGKGDKLKAEDMLSFLHNDKNLVHTPRVLKGISVAKAKEIRLAEHNKGLLSPSQRLMLVNMELSDNPQIKEAIELSKVAKDCVTSESVSLKLADATVKALEDLKERIENSPEFAAEQQKVENYNEKSQELADVSKKYNEAVSKHDLISQLNKIYNKLDAHVKTTNIKDPSLSREAVLKKIVAYLKTHDQMELRLAHPEVKIPLLIGRKNALGDQHVVNASVDAFNSGMSDLLRRYGPERVKELLGNDIEGLLSEKAVVKSKEEADKLFNKQQELTGQCIDPQSECTYMQYHSQCDNCLKVIKSKQEAKAEKQAKKLKKLKEVRSRLEAVKDPEPPSKEELSAINDMNPIAKEKEAKKLAKRTAERKEDVSKLRLKIRREAAR